MQLESFPVSAPRRDRLHMGLAWLALMGVVTALWAGLLYARPASNLEGVEQTAQRIFYTHMGMNMAALTGFVLSFLGSLMYLIRRRLDWDRLATAATEVGLIGAFGVLITGSIWAKPTWNTYWTWDPRLTTTTILVLVYVGYLLLRNGLENVRMRALFASIYALLAYVMVPLTYYSAVWFRSIHPMMFLDSNPEGQGDFSASVGPTMSVGLQVSMVAFAILALTLILLRWRLLKLDVAVRTLIAQHQR